MQQRERIEADPGAEHDPPRRLLQHDLAPGEIGDPDRLPRRRGRCRADQRGRRQDRENLPAEHATGLADPNPSHSFARVQLGEVSVRGFDIEARAQLMDELAAFGCNQMRAAFITDEALGPALPRECRVIAASELLDVALKALASGPLLYDLDGRGGHLAALVVDELVHAAEIHIALPMPQARKLRQLCRGMIQKPSLDLDLDGWAEHVGVSRSTFTRRFRAETGLSFAEWRRRLRMLHALTLQADGLPLRQAAKTTGYRSPNALRDMVRRTMSETLRPDPERRRVS